MAASGIIKDNTVYSKEAVINALDGSRFHWKKMLKWVEENRDCCSRSELEECMKKNLGESWHYTDCTLCTLFHGYMPHNTCNVCSEKCPLVEVGECCLHPTSIWWAVEGSRTVEEWIEGAKKMVRLLGEVLESYRGRWEDEEVSLFDFRGS